MRYLITDGFQACGDHPTDLPAYLVDDIIDDATDLSINSCETRPIWLNIEVPSHITAGSYITGIDIYSRKEQKVIANLCAQIDIIDRALPQPKDYTIHLNFWMQPYAASRYYDLVPYSQEHLETLRPYMQLLARAGQKVATAILFYEPWGVQSHDKFQPMIETSRKADGSWAYNYDIFDRWISFLETCGIDRQINCFSMVPWDMSFRYYDEVSKSYRALQTTTDTEEYKELWTSFLQSFASHLKAKGWYDKTTIAMDERALKDMLNAYEVAQAAVPGIKLSLAGNYHPELADKVFDYCIAYGQHFTEEELSARKAKGWISTTYNCCSEAAPNILANSEPAEATYVPLYCAANHFDGYLRWAWMNWPDNPLCDSRFRMFSPGDTYSIYPGPRSSQRFERFIHGIEAFEKVNVLRKEYKARGNETALQELETALSQFLSSDIEQAEKAGPLYRDILKVLNKPKQKLKRR
ncbi:MAG: DUF4091 domain-containing protein [Alloprevotella sp.]|nr:DUF4091 domain-containing protein [Alloprevotella sp.]